MMDNQLYQSSGATNFHKAVMLSACALSIWAGTGTNQSIPSFSSGSGQYFTSEFHNDSQREALFSDRVLEIKNFFGLNTTDLSRIFHVGRPTIYSWINDQVVPKKDSVKRMNLLYQLLKEVNQHNISNISEIKNQVISSDGTGLVEILEAKNQILINYHF